MRKIGVAFEFIGDWGLGVLRQSIHRSVVPNMRPDVQAYQISVFFAAYFNSCLLNIMLP